MLVNKTNIMREFTNNEKKFVKRLVSESSTKEMKNIGEILCDISDVLCIYYYEPTFQESNNVPSELLEDVIFQCDSEVEGEIESIVYEIVLLVTLLEREGYIKFIDDPMWDGENKIGDYVQSPKEEPVVISDSIANLRIWGILNKYYLVTNSLSDYAKDFKTVEQRRYEKTLFWTRFAAVCSFIAMFSSVAYGIIECVN